MSVTYAVTHGIAAAALAAQDGCVSIQVAVHRKWRVPRRVVRLDRSAEALHAPEKAGAHGKLVHRAGARHDDVFVCETVS